jgi:hypothetical protein
MGLLKTVEVEIKGKPWLGSEFLNKGLRQQTVCAKVNVSFHFQKFIYKGSQVRIK